MLCCTVVFNMVQVSMACIGLLSVYIVLIWTCVVYAVSPTVQTIWGAIDGINIQDGHGNHVEAYLGIPFAEPPVGDLRFKKPVPHAGSRGTFNASVQGLACTQIHIGADLKVKSIGQEDCLTMNVYVPVKKTSSRRSVLFWILGGGFIMGGASGNDPSPLATLGDVIVVTFQYRLGPFGFLSTLDSAAQGNYGLWDQLLALKWVKKNIGGFGGDPEQITIIGESAGAASVGILTVSPEAKGLFKRAILQSGTVTSLWSTKRDPLSVTYSIARRVGCGTTVNNHSALIDCMRNVPADTLASVSWPVANDFVTLLVNDVPYAPVVDGVIIVEDPHKILMSRKQLMASSFLSCDIMLGVNNNEGGDVYGSAVFYDNIFNTTLKDDIMKSNVYKTSLLPFLMKNFYGDYTSDMIEAASFEYLFPKHLSSKDIDLQSVENTKTDASFLAPSIQFARAHASLNGTGKTYMYYFDHYPKWTLPPDEAVSRGMHHGFDLYYTFGFSESIIKSMGFARNISSAEVTLSVTFRKILTQFAKFGDPSAAVQNFTSKLWSEFDATSEEYLDFNDHMAVRNHVAQRRVALWLDLLPRLRNNNTLIPAKGSGKSVLIPLVNIFG